MTSEYAGGASVYSSGFPDQWLGEVELMGPGHQTSKELMGPGNQTSKEQGELVQQLQEVVEEQAVGYWKEFSSVGYGAPG